jgi:hypothetical protein
MSLDKHNGTYVPKNSYYVIIRTGDVLLVDVAWACMHTLNKYFSQVMKTFVDLLLT